MKDYIKLVFEKHEGELCPSTNMVTFYGAEFDNIIEASKILKQLVPGEKYFVWYYNFHRGFLHSKSGRILIENRWLPNDDFAENYIDNLIKKNNIK